MSEEEETSSLYDDLMKIPVPPKIEKALSELAFNDDIFNLGAHDRDIEDGKEDINYTNYFWSVEACDAFHQAIINDGSLYHGCFWISYNVASILEKHDKTVKALISDDLNGIESWASSHSNVFMDHLEALPMIGFLKWRAIDLFNHKLSSDTSIFHSLEEYVRAFREYNGPRIERIRCGLIGYYQFMDLFDDTPYIPDDLSQAIEDRLMGITDMIGKDTFDSESPSTEFCLSDDDDEH